MSGMERDGYGGKGGRNWSRDHDIYPTHGILNPI